MDYYDYEEQVLAKAGPKVKGLFPGDDIRTRNYYNRTRFNHGARKPRYKSIDKVSYTRWVWWA